MDIPIRMDILTRTDGRGRWVMTRTLHNAIGLWHRTTGSAVEEWTVRPDGAHVLSHQAWYVNGYSHREDRLAYRNWDVAGDGTRVF